MYITKHIVNITTATDGSAEAYTSDILNGPILKIIYTKPTSNSFATGVDFNITTDETQQTVWKEDDVNASKMVAPVEKKQDTLGVDTTFFGPIYAANERIKISISNGGSGATGQFIILEG